MSTTLMKFIRHAWMNVAVIYLTHQLRAEKKEIRTIVRKRTLNRTYALQQLSHLHIQELAKSLQGQMVKGSYYTTGRTVELLIRITT